MFHIKIIRQRLQIPVTVPYPFQDDVLLLKLGAELEWVVGYFSASQAYFFLQTSPYLERESEREKLNQ